jgi:hypothetical protein
MYKNKQENHNSVSSCNKFKQCAVSFDPLVGPTPVISFNFYVLSLLSMTFTVSGLRRALASVRLVLVVMQ